MSGKPAAKPAWSAEDFAAMGAFMESFNKELAESGELVETRALAAPVHTRRVWLQSGLPVVTDGPYARDPGGPGRLLDRGLRELRSGRRHRRPAVERPGAGRRLRARR